jgi:hypothetical protein
MTRANAPEMRIAGADPNQIPNKTGDRARQCSQLHCSTLISLTHPRKASTNSGAACLHPNQLDQAGVDESVF